MKRKIALLICATMAFSGIMGCNKATTVSNTGETTSVVEESSSAEEATKVDEFANVDKELLARLMLANERLCLDAEKIDEMAFNMLEDSQLSISSENANFLKKPINYNTGICTKDGDTYEWSNFPFYSMVQEVTEGRYLGVLEKIDFFSEQINIIKENSCSLNTWVQIEGLKKPSLLTVTEDSEILYTTGNLNGGYNVCKRYTDEYARSVYEMYSVSSTNDESNLSRNVIKYVENTRLDICGFYTFGNLIEYCTIEKVGDDWTAFMISKQDDDWYKSYYYVECNDSNISYCYEFDYIKNVEPTVTLHLIDSVNKTELPGFDGYTLTVPFSSLIGYSCVRETDTDGTSIRGDKDYETDGFNAKLVLTDGKELQVGTYVMDDQVEVSGLYVLKQVRPNLYFGEVKFHINEPVNKNDSDYTMNLNLYREFLTKYGLSFTVDKDSLFEIFRSNQNSGINILNTHKVNNMPIASYEDIENIISAMDVKSEESVQLYESVKMNPSEIPVAFDITKIDFSSINVTADKAVLNESGLVIDGISVEMTDTLLLQQGEEYKIRLAYVRQCEDGLEPWGFSWVPIEEEETKVYEAGDTFEITTSFGTVKHDVAVAEGTYVIVAYISDMEGIRVSEFEPIVFESADNVQYELQFETGEKYKCIMELDENNYMTINCQSI